ncbi:MAG: lipid A biosynthesis lauroyl acyltransferase [Rickettsiales bacterium]
MIKKIEHFLEAFVLHMLFTAFRLFSFDTASKMGGLMAKAIGPSLSAHKTAKKNLSMVFPTLSEKDKDKLLNKMWDNLGRTAAELSHLQKSYVETRITVRGQENLPVSGKPAFMFSGHIGNWELLAVVAQICGRPITGVYREANNRIVDEMIAKIRRSRCLNLIPKGRQGAVKIARAIKNNEAISMLVDQKMNDGIEVPFFGKPAMTAPAIAELALRYNAPIIPARAIRMGGANFEVTIYKPIEYNKTGDKEKDARNIMLKINETLEEWIREYPEQWFWVHKRWPKE